MAIAEDRTDEEIIAQIKKILEDYVKPAVDSHGGVIDFVSYKDGHLQLILGGACSGFCGRVLHGEQELVSGAWLAQ